MTILKILLWIVGIYLFLCTAPTPGIDCSHYTGKTFYGVVVNCDRGTVRK